jgi:AcrR family transcriptional regulator
MTAAPARQRSTAEARRAVVLARAVTVFARNGYHATPVTEVAAAASISPAYVFRLFNDKLGLFVAALDHCYRRVLQALADGADSAAGGEPDEILSAMGGAYAGLIADRDLLMLQVHALSAADVPEIGEAVRRGYQLVVTFAEERSGGSPEAVQRFIAYGQLCHLIVAAGLGRVPDRWATTLTDGMRHPDSDSGSEPATTA